VYNTGGFDSLAALMLLDNIVDVYLPDAKYADKRAGAFCSEAENYARVNRLALREMFRQVGPLQTNADGLAAQGVLIRHLVLPHDLSGTGRLLSRLAREFGPGVRLSLMAQYFPCHLVAGDPAQFPELARPLTKAEYEAALDAAERLGLENVFIQELSASESYVPDFGSPEVFARTD
ncbi:MAG: radical SAM protein, partial [Thermodesulfobacteriota bacterium]|nr:radical SAM protein [Thermodesulfobacteriota bacterium]